MAPGVHVQTDEDILKFVMSSESFLHILILSPSYIRETALPVWHASGTSAMRPRNDGGVVDSNLKVYGVKGLRIADASIMPIIPDQHTQGPVYMIAEKVASLIRAEYGF